MQAQLLSLPCDPLTGGSILSTAEASETCDRRVANSASNLHRDHDAINIITTLVAVTAVTIP